MRYFYSLQRWSHLDTTGTTMSSKTAILSTQLVEANMAMKMCNVLIEWCMSQMHTCKHVSHTQTPMHKPLIHLCSSTDRHRQTDTNIDTGTDTDIQTETQTQTDRH